MAKLFVVQERETIENTIWHIFSNEKKADAKYDELEEDYEEEEEDGEDWHVDFYSVSGSNCGFLIGYDDDEGKVFAEPVNDVRKLELDTGDFGFSNTTAYLIGPKSKEGEIYTDTYSQLEISGNLQELAYFEKSKLIEKIKNSLKHVQLFEKFINSTKK